MAKHLFIGKRQILCSGRLPVEVDGSLLPFSSIQVPENVNYSRVLFCLKRYESEVRMTVIPRQLDF